MNVFISPSFLKVILLDLEFWFAQCFFFSLSTLWILFHFLLYSIVSFKNSTVIWIVVCLQIICLFLPVTFKCLSLWLVYKFANNVSGTDFFGFFLLKFAELLESVDLCLWQNLWNFQPSFPRILFLHYFYPFLRYYDDINARSFDILQVSEALFLKNKKQKTLLFTLGKSHWFVFKFIYTFLFHLYSACWVPLVRFFSFQFCIFLVLKLFFVSSLYL